MLLRPSQRDTSVIGMPSARLVAPRSAMCLPMASRAPAAGCRGTRPMELQRSQLCDRVDLLPDAQGLSKTPSRLQVVGCSAVTNGIR